MIFMKSPLLVVTPSVRGRAQGQEAWVSTGNLKSCCTSLLSAPAPPSHQHTAGSTVPPASLWLLEGWWLPPASAELQQEAPICPTPMGPVHPYLHIKHLQKPSEQNPSLSWGTLLPALAFALPDLAGHSGRKILTQLPQ